MPVSGDPEKYRKNSTRGFFLRPRQRLFAASAVKAVQQQHPVSVTDRCDAVVRPPAPSPLMIFAMRHTGAERFPGRRCHPVAPNVSLALGRSFCSFYTNR